MSVLGWHEFDPELLARNIAMREQVSDVPLHPNRCGPCEDCAEFLHAHQAAATISPVRSNVSLGQLIRHAEKFGTECVYETALDLLDDRDLARLRIELDEIESNRKSRGGYSIGKRRRRSEIETARYAWALHQELAETGLAETAIEQKIADKLGVSDPYARRVLKLGETMAETPEKPARKPAGEAKKSATKRETGIRARLGTPGAV